MQYPIRSSLYNSSCYLQKAEMKASRNIWAIGLCDLEYSMSSKNRSSYMKSNRHGWSSNRVNNELPCYVSEWTTPLSNAETQDFSKILGLGEEELFNLQVPMRSTASRDDINHCSYKDINEYGFQTCDYFEDAFDEIEDMLEGKKGWGDYFDDDDHTDGSDSEISDGDPSSIDSCSDDPDFYHSQEFESSGTGELAFQDCEIDFYHFQEFESYGSDELASQGCEIDFYHSQEFESSGSHEQGFQDCDIDFYHSPEVESSETDEQLGFEDCENGTGTEDDEALLERMMVTHQICEIDFYHSQGVESSGIDELVFQDCETGTEDDEFMRNWG